MTKLNGTVKQIAWATEIRDRAVDKHIDSAFAANAESMGLKPEMAAQYEIIKNNVKNCDSAKWWIENRGLFSCHSENYADIEGTKARALFEAAVQL